jgi:DNA polymerase III epsilon subunit-like protein
MVKICVFDTETTDKPPYLPGKDWNERTSNDAKLLQYADLKEPTSMWKQMLAQWPSIIQLSYIIYDTEFPEKTKIYNKYIDIPDDIVISDSAFEVHHINREKIRQLPAEKKEPIADSIKVFMMDIMNPEVVAVVGHNVQFDIKMVISELLRLKNQMGLNNSDIEKQLEFLMNSKNVICTMNSTSPICNIQMAINYKDKKTGQDKVFYKIKSPKLSEAYFHYFGYEPSGEALHDALTDVIVCLRVFMKYKYNEDVCGKSEIITEYIKRISPEGYVCDFNKENIDADVDAENIKLEIIDPFSEETTIVSSNANSVENNKKATKSKKGGKKTKNAKTKKRRRSKRIAALASYQKR